MFAIVLLKVQTANIARHMTEIFLQVRRAGWKNKKGKILFAIWDLPLQLLRDFCLEFMCSKCASNICNAVVLWRKNLTMSAHNRRC